RSRAERLAAADPRRGGPAQRPDRRGRVRVRSHRPPGRAVDRRSMSMSHEPDLPPPAEGQPEVLAAESGEPAGPSQAPPEAAGAVLAAEASLDPAFILPEEPDASWTPPPPLPPALAAHPPPQISLSAAPTIQIA